MNKNFFDRMSDSYENFHLKESKIGSEIDGITISAKLKLCLAWSVFILCLVLACIFVDIPVNPIKKGVGKEGRKDILMEEVKVDEEHDTIIPYEKDANKELNQFVEEYFHAITSCDYIKLQDMVTDADEYENDENLKKKAQFITGYDNITLYTKDGLEEDTYIAFVVANLTILGVNSSPYDIMTLYIVNGERGYHIYNSPLPENMKNYIEKIKGDSDIQKVYRAVETKNKQLQDQDKTLRDFYEIISRREIDTHSVAETQEVKTQSEESEEQKDDVSEETAQEEETENIEE